MLLHFKETDTRLCCRIMQRKIVRRSMDYAKKNNISDITKLVWVRCVQIHQIWLGIDWTNVILIFQISEHFPAVISNLVWISSLQLTWENNLRGNRHSQPPTAALMLFTLPSRPPHILSSHSEATSLSCLVTVSNTTVLPSLWQQMQPPFLPCLPLIQGVCGWVLDDPDPYTSPHSSLTELELCLNWHSHSTRGIVVVNMQYFFNSCKKIWVK